MNCIGCGLYSGLYTTCDECEKAFDAWEAKAPEREQAQRERLDSQGYYDDPVKWRKEHGSNRKG